MQAARLDIEYDGGPFKGWARQPGQETVEGALFHAFSELSLEIGWIRVAGRTDTGVHASAQVVAVHYTGSIPPERLASALRTKLPDAISILNSSSCPESFDARADALWRAYEYRVLSTPHPSPLRRNFVHWHPRKLDLDALNAAAEATLGKHDFTAFTPTETIHTFFHRTVLTSRWAQRGDELVYSLSADAFLRHMVRTLVGSQLAVGRGDMSIAEYVALLDGAPRSEAFNTAPPQGLCLVGVEYPVSG